MRVWVAGDRSGGAHSTTLRRCQGALAAPLEAGTHRCACPAPCPCLLCRAGPMLQRVVQLREEIAKWEAEEKERQRLEEMRAKRQAAGVPSLRPLMIRTGKAKTDGAAPLCCCATSCRLRSGARHRLQSPCAAATPPPQPPPPACRRRAHCAQGDGQGAVWQRAQLHL